MLASQPSAKPTRKMKATGIVGAVATLILAVAPQLGLDIPEDTAVYVAGALVAALAAGYRTMEARP